MHLDTPRGVCGAEADGFGERADAVTGQAMVRIVVVGATASARVFHKSLDGVNRRLV